ITAPLSSTRLMRSDNSSDVSSPTSADIRPLPGEVVGRPRAGKLDAEPTPLVRANKLRYRPAKLIDAIMRDEKRRVEHCRSRLLRRRLRQRIQRRGNRSRGELVVRERCDLRTDGAQLVLSRLLQLSVEQIALSRRFRACHLGFECGDARAEGPERVPELIVE